MRIDLYISDPLNSLNAQTRLVGDGDELLLEHRAAQNWVFTAQNGAIQVDFGDNFLGAGQMDSGIDRNLGLQHAADHALHAVNLRRRGNLQGVVKPAALHQLNVHQIGGPHLHNRQSVLGGKHALVSQHGNIGAFGDVLQALKIVGLDGLLYKLDVQPLVLHLVQQPDRLLGLPALVGINADAGLVSNGLPDSGKPGHVQFGVSPNLNFQGIVAPLHRVDGIPGHLFGGIDADGNVSDDLFPGTTHQLVDRNLVQLAVQVPKGHVYSRLCAGILYNALLDDLQHIFKIVHVMPHDALGDVVLDRADDSSGGIAGNSPSGRRLAVADSPGIRVDLHDHILHAVDRAQGRFEGHPQGDGNFAQLHFGNFHTILPFS